MRKPRPFSLRPIFVDARQERLDKAFASTRHQRWGGGWLWSIPMLLSVMLILVAVVLIIVFSRHGA